MQKGGGTGERTEGWRGDSLISSPNMAEERRGAGEQGEGGRSGEGGSVWGRSRLVGSWGHARGVYQVMLVSARVVE